MEEHMKIEYSITCEHGSVAKCARVDGLKYYKTSSKKCEPTKLIKMIK